MKDIKMMNREEIQRFITESSIATLTNAVTFLRERINDIMKSSRSGAVKEEMVAEVTRNIEMCEDQLVFHMRAADLSETMIAGLLSRDISELDAMGERALKLLAPYHR